MAWRPDANAPPQAGEWRPGWGTGLLVLLLLAAAIFLIFPVESASLQPWVAALQARLRQAVGVAAPYLVVALLGVVVGLSEIASAFPNYPSEALRTRWARVLVAINALVAAFAFYVAQTYAPEANLILLVVGVGVGFQALIRTRFTLAKSIGGAEGADFSFDVGWLYEQFQVLCKTQIDLELMRDRRSAVAQLIERFPTIAELHDIAEYTILARATLRPDEEKARLAELDRLFAPKSPTNFARSSLALMILENGGQAYVDFLLHQPPDRAPQLPTQEDVVKRLCEKHTLQELVELAQRMLSAPAEREWAQNAARPTPNANEASQKAAIAHFLVDRVGLDKARRELEP